MRHASVPGEWLVLAPGRLDARFWIAVIDQLDVSLTRRTPLHEVPINEVRLAIARVTAKENA